MGETTASFNPARILSRLTAGSNSYGLDSSLFARRYWGNIITILFMSPTIRTRE